jgi:hypothetical protein
VNGRVTADAAAGKITVIGSIAKVTAFLAT